VLWLVAALLVSVVSTIGTIVDSHLLSKKMPSLSSYLIPMSITQLIAACVMLAVFPFHNNGSFMHILVGFGSAILNACSILIVLNALRKSEVSRVIPIISVSPIFIALLSIPLLGEKLGYWQWLAILMTVIGAILISLQRSHGDRKTRLHKSLFILLLAALISAICSIGYKYALETMSVWNMYSLTGICIAVIILSYSVRKENLLELKNLPQRTPKIGLVVGNMCIGIAGTILLFVAVRNGPVALVNAILNVRPAFVFLLSLGLSRFFPDFIMERLNSSTVLLKAVAVLLMTGGVIIISLTSR
jgi:drug/metabolite transporter (DMT)-like permease